MALHIRVLPARAPHPQPLEKLLKDFGMRMRRISRLSAKIGDLSIKAGSKPSLWSKLDAWMTQLDLLRNKELEVLSKIRAIEDKHGALRKQRKLKRARPRITAAPAPVYEEPRRRKIFWSLLLLVWALQSRKKIPQKELRNG